MRPLSHAGLAAFVMVGLAQVGVGLAWHGHPPLALFLGCWR